MKNKFKSVVGSLFLYLILLIHKIANENWVFSSIFTPDVLVFFLS